MQKNTRTVLPSEIVQVCTGACSKDRVLVFGSHYAIRPCRHCGEDHLVPVVRPEKEDND